MADDRPRIKLPTVPRARRVWTFLGACIAIASAAFIAGTFVRAPAAPLLDAQDEHIAVYAEAEMRHVDDGLRAQGQVIAGPESKIIIDRVAEAQRLVVTRMSLSAGQDVTNGTLIGAVSGRPYFAFFLKVPLYRELRRGDAGPDVASLQTALGVAQTGTVDNATLESVRNLYNQADVEPPGGRWSTFIDPNEFYSMRSEDFRPHATSVAEVGDILDSESPIAILKTGPDQVEFRATVVEVKSLKPTMEVIVRGVDGVDMNGVIRSIGPFVGRGDDSSSVPGHDIVVDFTEPPSAEIVAGQTVTIVTAESVATLAVPIAAIRSDSGGDYVLVEPPADSAGGSRINVTILRQADGWAAISATSLSPGDRVRVTA